MKRRQFIIDRYKRPKGAFGETSTFYDIRPAGSFSLGDSAILAVLIIAFVYFNAKLYLTLLGLGIITWLAVRFGDGDKDKADKVKYWVGVGIISTMIFHFMFRFTYVWVMAVNGVRIDFF